MKVVQVLLIVILVGGCSAHLRNPNEDNVNMAKGGTRAELQLPVEGDLPSFAGATGWLNSQPLTRGSLGGKVVLVQFWTYTCINWRRTEPYIRAWAEKYKDQGLVVIGVHTPEFEFEKDLDNVTRETKAMQIEYPVAIDSDYKIWSAFDNHYWPALYFVDAKGQIRHHQFGEGDYEGSERVIQQLLTEAGNDKVGHELSNVNGQDAEAAADWDDLRSNENYVGYERTEGFASVDNTVRDKKSVYAVPTRLDLNQWDLSGEWTITRNAVTLSKPNGRIVYRFHARDLHLVMGPGKRGAKVRFRVLLDGTPPGASHGTDIDDQGYGTATEQRLYQLIRQTPPIADRQFEIEFLDPGTEAFVFTFG